MNHRKLLASPKLLYVILLAGFISFVPSLWNDYNLDDQLYVHDRYDDKTFSGAISEIFSKPTFEEADGVKHEYRPITALTFYLERSLFGPSPFTGHVVNLILYLLLLGGIWRFCFAGSSDDNRIILFFSLILFAVHPLHSEVVCSIKNRDELLVMIFGLAALGALFRYQKSGRGIPLVFMLLFFLLSCLSKKSGLLFLPILLLFYWVWQQKFNIRNFAQVFLGLAFTTAAFVYFHDSLELNERSLIIYENELISPKYGTAERMATGFAVIWKYFWMFFCPWPLSSYYGYPVIKIVTFASWQAIAGLVVIVASLFFGIRSWINKRRIGACVLAFTGSMIAISNLVELIPGIFGERLMFIPSFFLSVLVATAAYKIYRRNTWSIAIIGSIMIMLFTSISILRSTQWTDHETLYNADVAAHPDNLKLRLELHALYLSKAASAATDDEKSEYLLRARHVIYEAARLAAEDQSIAALKRQAACLTGDEEVCMDGGNPAGLKMLAEHFLSAKDTARAIVYFDRHLKAFPEDFVLYETLNRLYFKTGETSKGIVLLREAIRRFPDSPLGYAEMANHYLAGHDTLSAIPYIEKAAVRPPKNRGVIDFLIRYYAKKGMDSKVREYQILQEKAF